MRYLFLIVALTSALANAGEDTPGKVILKNLTDCVAATVVQARADGATEEERKLLIRACTEAHLSKLSPEQTPMRPK